jgi:hypothetical protein
VVVVVLVLRSSSTLPHSTNNKVQHHRSNNGYQQPKHIMSKNISDMFPDVFAYPSSNQEIQLSSFYDQPRVQAKTSYSNPHVFGHIPTGTLSSNNSNSSKVGIGIAPNCVGTSSNGGNQGSNYQLATANNSVTTGTGGIPLPPMRRVVKLSFSPQTTTLAVGISASVNVMLCLLIPASITPVMDTLWGCFLYIWALISIIQLISHSVYLCTPSAMTVSVLHTTLVTTSALVVPRSMSHQWLWIAPCICTLLIAYQVYMFCLIYTHIQRKWIYATLGSILVVLPLTQLIQIESVDTDTVVMCCVWSSISICTLYGFALANCNGAVLVDVTVGASPTWQLQE